MNYLNLSSYVVRFIVSAWYEQSSSEIERRWELMSSSHTIRIRSVHVRLPSLPRSIWAEITEKIEITYPSVSNSGQLIQSANTGKTGRSVADFETSRTHRRPCRLVQIPRSYHDPWCPIMPAPCLHPWILTAHTTTPTGWKRTYQIQRPKSWHLRCRYVSFCSFLASFFTN